MTHNWTDYIPHAHKILWLAIACTIAYKLSDWITFLKDCLSEPDIYNANGQLVNKGKGSSKRLIMFFFASTFVYLCIYSIHARIILDKYLITVIAVFLLLALKIIMPEQANNLIDKLKGFMNFNVQPDKTTVNTKTETTIEVPNQNEGK